MDALPREDRRKEDKKQQRWLWNRNVSRWDSASCSRRREASWRQQCTKAAVHWHKPHEGASGRVTSWMKHNALRLGPCCSRLYVFFWTFNGTWLVWYVGHDYLFRVTGRTKGGFHEMMDTVATGTSLWDWLCLKLNDRTLSLPVMTLSPMRWHRDGQLTHRPA